MRSAFIETLTALAETDPDLLLLTGDVGFSVFENFREKFPGRFYNAGIAEANLMGVASGLAACGKTVFAYSIMPFITLKCYEQIKLDVCYHKLGVKIVGVGGGVSYGSQGPTHQACDDIALMRILPGMRVICPADPFEARQAVKAAAQTPGPFFIRLGKNGEPALFPGRSEFQVGKGYQAREGKDLTLLATGSMVETALKTALILEAGGLSSRVVSLHTVKPLDEELILKCRKETGALFTLEEHSLIGGLGSAVAEVLAALQPSPGEAGFVFRPFALPDAFIGCAGSQQYLRECSQLAPEQIARAVTELLGAGPKEGNPQCP